MMTKRAFRVPLDHSQRCEWYPEWYPKNWAVGRNRARFLFKKYHSTTRNWQNREKKIENLGFLFFADIGFL